MSVDSYLGETSRHAHYVLPPHSPLARSQYGQPLAPPAGGWKTVGPGELPFGGYPAPRAMGVADIEAVVADFRRAAGFALAAGFEAVEVHAAHGYLLHEFLSPLSNPRRDDFGGSLDNRMRLPLAVARAVREAWPESKPVFVRISATDWSEGGWALAQSVAFSKELLAIGIDLVDCSSGGNVADAKVPLAPGYQTPFAEAIRREVGRRVERALVTDTPTPCRPPEKA